MSTESSGHATRRRVLQALSVGVLAWSPPAVFADALTVTPKQTEGPFYPDKLPLDTDNDLLIVNDKTTAAVGEITHLTGRVLSPAGVPIRNATVEIWQVDNNGVYLHSRDPRIKERDSHFQSFGRFLTDSKGGYYFRTIKPVPYKTGIQRTPHIHVIVRKGERRLLTTQLYVKGHPMNARDGIYRRIRDDAARASVTVDFQPLKGSKIDELTADFDIVLGTTPEDA